MTNKKKTQGFTRHARGQKTFGKGLRKTAKPLQGQYIAAFGSKQTISKSRLACRSNVKGCQCHTCGSGELFSLL